MAKEYKVKKDCEVHTSDFWYDLTDGGYIKPSEILENAKDVLEVEKAIAILEKFKISCENQIEEFYY